MGWLLFAMIYTVGFIVSCFVSRWLQKEFGIFTRPYMRTNDAFLFGIYNSFWFIFLLVVLFFLCSRWMMNVFLKD